MRYVRAALSSSAEAALSGNSLEHNSNIAYKEFALYFFRMTDKIVILSTCASEEEGQTLARLLIEQRLAACVSLIPRMRSVYRWKDAIESTEECLLIVKTSRELFDPLR